MTCLTVSKTEVPGMRIPGRFEPIVIHGGSYDGTLKRDGWNTFSFPFWVLAYFQGF